MRLETIVVGGVLAVVALTALLVLWLGSEAPVQEPIGQGLAEPQAPSRPPAMAPVVMPASSVAAPKAAPRSISVLFEFDSAALRDAEAAKLDALLSVQGTGWKRVDAVGHAGRIGQASYNLKLSERRAASVRDYLVDSDVEAHMVRTSAKGELESITGDACLDMGAELRSNAGLVECLHADRRVEVTVIAK